MADSKVTNLTELTTVASSDTVYIIDVSDTTDGANGTAKKSTVANLFDALTLSNVTDVTASAAEVNILDGATLDVNELNVLDGIPATLTATELGYVDGVTSAIQTQINTKAPTASPTFTGTVTLPTGLTGVIRTDSGVVSVDSDVTDIVAAASTTAAGKIEIAIASELNTGTDATRAVSPDSLAGSVFGEVVVQVVAVEFVTDVTTGDGKFYVHIDDKLGGMDLVRVHAQVVTAGTTGTTDVQIHNLTQAADMLTTKITIDSTETGSHTAATPAVIDTTNDDIATNDVLRIDVDAVSTTAPKGLIVTMVFRLP